MAAKLTEEMNSKPHNQLWRKKIKQIWKLCNYPYKTVPGGLPARRDKLADYLSVMEQGIPLPKGSLEAQDETNEAVGRKTHLAGRKYGRKWGRRLMEIILQPVSNSATRMQWGVFWILISHPTGQLSLKWWNCNWVHCTLCYERCLCPCKWLTNKATGTSICST